MGIGSWGGGIVLGLVAVLWLVYLIPSWAKRQQYLATERNAVRLQQTLRILAQTAELPEEVRVEANAKSVATAQKILRSEESKREAIRRAQEAARQRAVTRELAATAPVLRAADAEPALAARRLRRTRLVSTLVLVASLIAFVAGIVGLPSAWLLLVAGTIAGAGSVVMLGQLSAVSRARARRARVAPAVTASATPVAQAFHDFAPSQAADGAVAEAQDPAGSRSETASRQWTPVAMPRPLYLRRGSARALARSAAVAGSATNAADAAALQEAAAASAEALRQEQARRQEQEAASQDAQREALREVARAEAALQAQRSARSAGSVGSAGSAGSVGSDGSARDAPVVAAVAADPEPSVAPAAEAPAATSRFARMGFYDEGEIEQLSLDDVLQRRRAV